MTRIEALVVEMHQELRSFLHRQARVSLLRFERSRTGNLGTRPGLDPPASQTSPSMFVAPREQLVLAVPALDLLLDRDRDLVGWAAEGLPLAEQARRPGALPASIRDGPARGAPRP